MKFDKVRTGARHMTVSAGLAMASAGLLPFSNPAMAFDTQALDFVPGPKDINIVILYNFFAHNDTFNIAGPGGATISKSTHLETDVTALRGLRYFDMAGHTLGVNFVLPFVNAGPGEIGGNPLNHTFGFGDPFIDVSYWIKEDAKTGTFIGLSNFTTFPLGAYNNTHAVNAGANRYNDILLAFANQALAPNLKIEGEAEITAYTNNTNYGPVSATLHQKPTYTLEAWLTYFPVEGTTASIGYVQDFGGRQNVNGAFNGSKTVRGAVRADFSTFFRPNLQGLLELNHDIYVQGEFHQEIGVTTRLVYLF